MVVDQQFLKRGGHLSMKALIAFPSVLQREAGLFHPTFEDQAFGQP